LFFWGCPSAERWVGLCQGSQVCSALRRFAPWSGPSGHPYSSLSQSSEANNEGASPSEKQGALRPAKGKA